MASPFDKIEDHLFFNWTEVAIALVKFKGLHEGLWRVGVQVDVHGATVNIPVSNVQNTAVPAAMVPILNVNLKQVTEDKADQLTVDAAVVNPRSQLVTIHGGSIN